MNFLNKILVIGVIATLFVSVQWVEAAESCDVQAQKIKAAVKTCQIGSESNSNNDIWSKIATATLTVDELNNYATSNCGKLDEITECVIQQKALLADASCNTDSAYNHAIFSLNHVIRLNLFVCGKRNGNLLLAAMIPNEGLKCFYGNEKYVNCVRSTESKSDLPDICANIDVRMNCLHTANDCANPVAVESFRNLFLLYKEKIVC